jgi:hypothetical protein
LACRKNPEPNLRYLYLLSVPNILGAFLLLYRAKAMCLYLEEQGIHCRITKFWRKPKTAHRWSTAHHIVTGKITLERLRQLEGGQDLDGNVWYRPEWDAGYDGSVSASVCQRIRQNAVHLGPPQTVYSEEGYPPNDPARLPNLPEIPISRHVYGLAIDMMVAWDGLDGAWSDRAASLVRQFGLARPVASESWHFELDARNGSNVSPFQFARWVIQAQFRRSAIRAQPKK